MHGVHRTSSGITALVESWFATNQRALPWRSHYDPFAVWVSEVMLQQTRMEVVLPYHARFMARFPDVRSLADASFDEVHALWSGLGYYRRARMLHEGAKHVVEVHGGEIPSGIEALRAIPGVGRYTAGAIASIAFDVPAAIVDGNVTRLLSRVFGLRDPLGSTALASQAWSASEELIAAAASPRSLNQGLMELGATICTPRNADCVRCPLRDCCAAFASDEVHALPVPKEKAATRELHIPLYLVRDDEGRVLLLRATGALMSGMFHLPHGNAELLPSVAVDWTASERIGTIRHTVTNRKITFDVFRAEAPSRVRDRGGAVWVSPSDLESLPHPSYVKKAIDLAGSGKGRRRTSK